MSLLRLEMRATVFSPPEFSLPVAIRLLDISHVFLAMTPAIQAKIHILSHKVFTVFTSFIHRIRPFLLKPLRSHLSCSSKCQKHKVLDSAVAAANRFPSSYSCS